MDPSRRADRARTPGAVEAATIRRRSEVASTEMVAPVPGRPAWASTTDPNDEFGSPLSVEPHMPITRRSPVLAALLGLLLTAPLVTAAPPAHADTRCTRMDRVGVPGAQR